MVSSVISTLLHPWLCFCHVVLKIIILGTETREMNISSCSMMAIKADRIDAVLSLLTQVKSANQQDMTTLQEVV